MSLEVKLNREFKPVRNYKGVEIVEDDGRNYVDVYWPDGTQRTMGYISRDKNESRWTPCHQAPQAVFDAIQQAINLQRGGAAKPPHVLTTFDSEDK